MFAYCLNNPIRYIDSGGMYTIEPEIKINGLVYTLEAQTKTSWGTLTLTIVIDISAFKAYETKVNDFNIEIDGSSLEIAAPDGQTLSFDLSAEGVEADSHTIRMIQSGKSSVNMAVSKNGFGLCCTAETDGLEYSVTLSHKPNLWSALLKTVGKWLDKAASIPSPSAVKPTSGGRWKQTAQYAKNSFAAHIGVDLLCEPFMCYINR